MESDRPNVFPLGLLAHEMLLVGTILVIFVVGAFVAAVVVLGWGHALIGSIVGACLMSFIGIPLWLATLNDDLEEQTHGPH